MSDLVMRLRTSAGIDDVHDAADLIEAQAAEIIRLRAALAAARREGMEEAAKIAAGSYPDESRYDPRSPLYGMDLNPDRSEFGRGKEAGRKEAAAAIRAAAKEDRPIEEIIREDRDAWPDRQANDPIRAAARREGMEEAAKIADSCAADWAKSANGKYLETKWDYESRADAGEEIAAAIRAAAKEGEL